MLTQEELDAISREPYEHRGILHSEMALIIHTARVLEIEVFIESGRARGQSTYMLAKYLPDTEIHSVEMRDSPDDEFARRRLADFRNVTLWTGDGAEMAPSLAASGAKRTAVLCDGPKGAKAVAVVQRCFQSSHVMAGFIHDMRRLDHGMPSPHRAAATAAFRRRGFSDAPGLVAGTSWMDKDIIAVGGPAGPAWEAVHGSYGPTIGVFLNA